MPLVQSLYMYWDVRSKVELVLGTLRTLVSEWMFTRALPIARCIILLQVISRAQMSRKETSY